MMSNESLNKDQIREWLLEKFAYKLGVGSSELDKHMLFVDFGIDSTEVLLLTGELEDWIGIELPPTAMWYHPTIDKLALFIEEELELVET